jgi:hypothetical protein
VPAWPHLLRFVWRVWAQVLIWNSATPYSAIRDALLPLLVLVAMTGIRIKQWRMPKAQELITPAVWTFVVTLVLLGGAFIFATPVVVYQDHNDLVAKISKSKSEQNELRTALARLQAKLTKTESELASLHNSPSTQVVLMPQPQSQQPTPVRDPDSFYQLDRVVATVSGAVEDLAHDVIRFEFARSTAALNSSREVEYRDFILQCSGMPSLPPGVIVGTYSGVVAGLSCDILRKR